MATSTSTVLKIPKDQKAYLWIFMVMDSVNKTQNTNNFYKKPVVLAMIATQQSLYDAEIKQWKADSSKLSEYDPSKWPSNNTNNDNKPANPNLPDGTANDKTHYDAQLAKCQLDQQETTFYSGKVDTLFKTDFTTIQSTDQSEEQMFNNTVSGFSCLISQQI